MNFKTKISLIVNNRFQASHCI